VGLCSYEVAGVDFAVYKDGSEAVVESDRGQKCIESHGDEFRYTNVTGNPLELGRLEHGFKTDKGQGFKTDKTWLKRLR
jgi:hypothetical protein